MGGRGLCTSFKLGPLFSFFVPAKIHKTLSRLSITSIKNNLMYSLNIENLINNFCGSKSQEH